MKTKATRESTKAKGLETHTNRPIHSKDGKVLGTIRKVVYSPDRSRIRYAVIDFGEPFTSGKETVRCVLGRY